MPFSRLPDPSLQLSLREFEWHNTDDNVKMQSTEVQYIASLTALKTLRLKGFYDWSSLKPLHTLPLQCLWLIQCGHMELDLFAPSSLQSLTEICIKDRVSKVKPPEHAKYSVTNASLERRFAETAFNMLMLPKLSLLFGESQTHKLVRKAQDIVLSYQNKL